MVMVFCGLRQLCGAGAVTCLHTYQLLELATTTANMTANYSVCLLVGATPFSSLALVLREAGIELTILDGR